MSSTIGKYATEIAVIECPDCGEENQIVAERGSDWSCRNCGFEPEWTEDVRECLWCSKNIEGETGLVALCLECSREAQRRQKLKESQCCPHCNNRLTADDLRKIKDARQKARERMEEVGEDAEN